ncbi:uncharacterized protein LOC107039196 [Diachasma alloeum]|uniref:uncharacterized protein LOC107039196 n=1 Tax=Diachasma alloeum TaxID=454923 RepID=UPI00073813D4|nr:uncharacterized protein LOC107039196 [Diachasma alloeum]XP_015114181.1 uncharacterized protein LOC107039196 [Diachasma alloeum]
MKLIVFLFINFVAYAASEQYAYSANLEKVTKQANPWMIVDTYGDSSVEEVVIPEEITDDDGLTIEYSIKDESDNVVAEGSGPLCSEPDSMDELMGSLLGQFLDVDLECPISKQKGKRVATYQTGPIELAEDPGSGQLFSDISIKKGDQAIVTVSVYGRTK